MPLQKPNEVKQVFLPSSKDLPEGEKEWVTLEVGKILGGDMLGAMGGGDATELTVKILLGRIREWNIKDIDGEVAEVNLDSVKRLDVADLTYLLNEFVGASEATETDPKVLTGN